MRKTESAPKKKSNGTLRPRKAVVRACCVPVLIRTELRTGSGVKVLDEHKDTERRYVRIYPDGHKELLPRSYIPGERSFA